MRIFINISVALALAASASATRLGSQPNNRLQSVLDGEASAEGHNDSFRKLGAAGHTKKGVKSAPHGAHDAAEMANHHAAQAFMRVHQTGSNYLVKPHAKRAKPGHTVRHHPDNWQRKLKELETQFHQIQMDQVAKEQKAHPPAQVLAAAPGAEQSALSMKSNNLRGTRALPKKSAHVKTTNVVPGLGTKANASRNRYTELQNRRTR